MNTNDTDHELVLQVRDRATGGSIGYTTTLGILEALTNHLGPDGQPILVEKTIRDWEDPNRRRPIRYFVSQHHRQEPNT